MHDKNKNNNKIVLYVTQQAYHGVPLIKRQQQQQKKNKNKSKNKKNKTSVIIKRKPFCTDSPSFLYDSSFNLILHSLDCNQNSILSISKIIGYCK